MKGQAQVFSSARTEQARASGSTDEWGTPQALFDLLNSEFNFTLDPCASADNAKAPYFSIDEGVDGLAEHWGANVCFVNFPYSTAKAWAAKCIEAAHAGATVVVLCASRTDTAWWQSLASVAAELRFIRGRLSFTRASGGSTGAPFPSSVIVLKPGLCVNDPHVPALLWELPSEVRRGVGAQ